MYSKIVIIVKEKTILFLNEKSGLRIKESQ